MDDTLKFHIRHSIKGCKALDICRRLGNAIRYAQADHPSMPLSSNTNELCLSTSVRTKLEDIEIARAAGENQLRDVVVKMCDRSSFSIKYPTPERLMNVKEAITNLNNEIELFCKLIDHLSTQFEGLETSKRSKDALSLDLTFVPQAIYSETVLKTAAQSGEQLTETALDEAKTAESSPSSSSSSSLESAETAVAKSAVASMNALMFNLTFQMNPHYVSYLLDLVGSHLTPLKSYTLEGEFGCGGQGTVYRAKELDDGTEGAGEKTSRLIALKVNCITRNSYRSVTREVMFVCREASSSLQHPNILSSLYCSVFAVKKDYFMALAFEPMFDGSLDKYVEFHWPDRYIACVLRQVLLALSYLHSKGIVHNDVKSDNILLSTGTVKLADFGKAMRLAEFEPNIRGTLRWAAPELISAYLKGDKTSNSFTTAADIWSLGATLYELLEGNYPFHVYNNSILHDVIPTQRLALTNSENHSNAVVQLFSS
ncbi:Protein kinase of the Mitotic Exit Network [Tyrophagus putrescentiae]|nr:Protein kinase of the Mitotic Exit Network [Tyrophagus putrescentiae]